ncbi:sigma-54-dependent Fis family transcriptional regulator [Evansella halocellulosilytica]|uniref:sigma-54-dependent Fis family transcriptional regulator n=1 Tax=Evansella halocellulosilytica TaxID=2011013 RepID=UPI000BB90497|nr:sigma-54-dependent transcriptional regulator [Evansella halocellulosilytica]
MNIKTLVIAPYKGLAELINSMEHEFEEFSITSHVADLNQSLVLLENYKRSGEEFDVIISRGGTAKVLRENTSIPVIDIHISGYDILRILTLLKSYNVKIGMVGFKNVIYSFEAVSSVINIDVEYRVVDHESEVKNTLVKMKEQGISIIVGDAITVRLAISLGMQGVLITSGKESVYEAFNKAKALKTEIEKYSSKAETFNNLLNQLSNPVCLMRMNGELYFSNLAFKQRLVSTEKKNFFHIHPKLPLAFDESFMDLPISFYMYEGHFKQPPRMNIGRVSDSKLTTYFYLELENGDLSVDNEVNVIMADANLEHVPQLIASDRLFQETMNDIEQKKEQNSITIIGERGTGKRIFIKMLWEKEPFCQGTMTEFRFNHPSTRTFNRIIQMLQSYSTHDIIHFSQIENLTATQQKKLHETIKNYSLQAIYTFCCDKSIFHETIEKFDRAIKDELLRNAYYFPPLRERQEMIEHMIRTFILHFNERYGKQVIGVEEGALETLIKYPWYGNISELRKAVKLLVKNSSDILIKDVKSVLKTVKIENSQGNQSLIPININQTLSEIERDIIEEVYLQENENQSKASKRLGINRSTLWRKLNS